MLRTKGEACDNAEEVTGLARADIRKKGKEGPCRDFCKGKRETVRPLEEGTLSSKAVWSVWVFFLFKKAFPNERNNSLLVCCWGQKPLIRHRRGEDKG